MLPYYLASENRTKARVKCKTSHEMNSVEWIKFMISSMFDPTEFVSLNLDCSTHSIRLLPCLTQLSTQINLQFSASHVKFNFWPLPNYARMVYNIVVHQVDSTTTLSDHILQTWPGDPPVMEVSNVVNGSSFGVTVLDPVKKTKPQWKQDQLPQNNTLSQGWIQRRACVPFEMRNRCKFFTCN